MAYIYKHIRLDTNEVFYIGIGSDNKGKYSRAYSKGRNQYWHKIVDKAGYQVEILLDNLTWQEACDKEIELIKFYGRKDLKEGCLVNMTNGGDGTVGCKLSEEHKNAVSNAQLGKKLSEETKDKLRNINLGKMASQETKEKHRNSSKNRMSSPENIEKMRQLMTGNKITLGYKHTKETKEKISQCTAGKKQSLIKCPHCNKIGGKPLMTRYHFSNCKMIGSIGNTNLTHSNLDQLQND